MNLTMRLLRRRTPRSDAGSASVELALLVPVFVLALALMVVAGRHISAGLITQDAAAAAARAASLQRDPASAYAHARQTAERELRGRGVVCEPFAVSADTARFEPGGVVEVVVACTVTVLDLGGPGGQSTLSGTASSPVDPYRGAAP